MVVMSVDVFFFQQKTAYDMRISDWSSAVCSSDLVGRPDLTAERSIANPFHDEPGFQIAYRTGDRVVLGFDGKLRFHGRADDQVKVSGYRIELAEISACLQELSGVEEAVTIAHPSGPQSRSLIVAHVGGADLPEQEAILRHADRKSTRLNSSH